MQFEGKDRLPVFGELLTPVHPFDFYDLTRHRALPKQIGETGVPIMQEDGRCYLSSAPIFDVEGMLYLVTTTVKPSETCSLR